jgi:hypothetical protein
MTLEPCFSLTISQDPGPNAVQSALFFAGGQVQKSAIAVEEEAAKHMPAAKALSQEVYLLYRALTNSLALRVDVYPNVHSCPMPRLI